MHARVPAQAKWHGLSLLFRQITGAIASMLPAHSKATFTSVWVHASWTGPGSVLTITEGDTQKARSAGGCSRRAHTAGQ